MNIFRNEIRMCWKSTLIWALSLAGLTLFFMSIYPSFAKEMDLLLELFKSFPPELVKALGITNISGNGIIGFYSFVLIYILLAGSIQAMNLGVSVLSEEVRDKTADFLYSKPVSRCKIITMKMLTVFVMLVLTNLLYAFSAWLILAMISSAAGYAAFDFGLFLLLTATLALLQLFFASLGLAVSALMRRIRTVLPISMGVVFFFYILYMLNQTLDNAALAYLSPFSYLELSKVMAAGGYESRYLITLLLLSGLFLLATGWSYLKKDLPSI